MNVQFRQLNGKIFKLALNKFETIGDVKQKIAAHLNSQADSIKLLLQTTVLPDNKTLADYSIDGTSIIKIQGGKCQRSPLNHNTFSCNSVCDLDSFDKQEQECSGRQFLPPRSGFTREIDSVSFRKQVDILCDMGFERQKAIKALKAAFYNQVKAIEFLLNDKIPESVSLDLNMLKKDRDNYSRNDQEVETTILQCDSETLSLLKGLSKDEKNDIRQLQEMGFEREQIIQVYLACRDCNTAATCLASINGHAGNE